MISEPSTSVRSAGAPTRPVDTKAALLLAAEQLFSDRGYAAVGIREIAALAETNVSSIKYHFGSKRGLYVETIRWLLQHPDLRVNWDVLEPLPKSRSAAAAVLVEYIHISFEQAAGSGRSARCVRLLLQEALRPCEDFDFIQSTFSAPYERQIIALVRVIAPGREDVFYTTAARSIFAHLLHYHVWRAFLEYSDFGALGSPLAPVAATADEVACLVLRGFGCSERFTAKALAAASSATSSPG